MSNDPPRKQAVKVRLSATGSARSEALKALEAKGFQLRHDLPELDLVTGDVDADALDGLTSVVGVESCEPDPSAGLPDGER